jgi:hypothetical protein
MTLTETDTLPIGIEVDGITHQDFELREQLVLDGVEVLEDMETGARAAASDVFYNVAVMAKRLIRLGSLPKASITAVLLLGMHQDDFNAIAQASQRMAARRATFRGPAEGQAPADPGAEKAGV